MTKTDKNSNTHLNFLYELSDSLIQEQDFSTILFLVKNLFVKYFQISNVDIFLKEVKRSELKRGDLMFFTNASRKDKTGMERIGHVGIYFGNNYILHTASDHAVIEPISSVRWSYYVTARRVI